jgi:plastocyanin
VTTQLLEIQTGDTVNFNVSASGHPFYIKTAQSTGTGDQVAGVTNNGSEGDTVSWTPTSAGTRYYVCENHADMTGEIVVS